METNTFPDPASFESLVDLLDDAAERYPADRRLLSLRDDQGIRLAWSASELRHRAQLAAWRLRSRGLRPGHRLLTWSPSTPELAAVYYGAMMAGVIFVPLDMRMAPGVVRRISDRAEPQLLAMGSDGTESDTRADDLAQLDRVTLEELVADVDPTDPVFPPDWQEQLLEWPRPTRESLVEVIYTSGTTSAPKGVQLTHGTFLSTLEVTRTLVPPRHHRMVSILPLSHLLEQAIVLFYGNMLGGETVYVSSYNPRTLFSAVRELRATTMIVPPQILQLFWTALVREVDREGKRASFERARRISRHLPMRWRRKLLARIHARLGGELTVFVTAGAYLPPELQRDWESLGIIVVQGYGSTEAGPVSCNTERDHPTGVVGHSIPPVQVKLADEDSEILVAGPTVTPGYWRDPAADAEAFAVDGWYRSGDIGRFDDKGRLVLVGRKKNVIALPSGLNVYPEDIEILLAESGLDQAVVLETTPGRIEAVVMPPGTTPVVAPGRGGQEARDDAEDAAVRARIDELVVAVNAQLATHQRLDAWRMWPEPDFPRTHMFKIKRAAVAEWAQADVPLPVQEAA